MYWQEPWSPCSREDFAIFFQENQPFCLKASEYSVKLGTVVPGFRVLGFSALPGFRALKAGDGAWSVHKTLFGFRAPLFQLFIKKIRIFTAKSLLIFALFTAKKLTFCPFCCKKMTFVGVWMVFTAKLLTKLTFD